MSVNETSMKDKVTGGAGKVVKKWGETEKDAWFRQQKVRRSYQDEVVQKLDNAIALQAINSQFLLEKYGELSYVTDTYPLYVVKAKIWDAGKKTLLVTGGVHGYETSGVQGAIRFIERVASNYVSQFNIVVAPCVSPWGYETINRWNPHAIDPNRSFYENSPAAESAALMKLIASLQVDIDIHVDLHETTDTDNSVFRPALSARDGVEQSIWTIPDGFYLVGDSDNPADDFQRAVIDSVKKVTHIAPADDAGKLIGEPVTQSGVINYPTQKLGLCTGFSNSQFCTTTEVYPDSSDVTDEECIVAQVAAITGALDYVINV